MTVKDVLLLLRHRYQSPVPRSKLKYLTFFDKKAHLDAEIFFGFSNSEFINDNTFSLKDRKRRIRDFKFGTEQNTVNERKPPLVTISLLKTWRNGNERTSTYQIVKT